ncbi:MAG: hypothetical protein Q4G04_05390 [bacterium]|nr:hypothetical protein [bacterium]
MKNYTDDDIKKMKNISTKIAGYYLGIPPMAVAIGLREEKLPIGFSIKRSNKWSYYIVAERLIAYKNGNLEECLVDGIEDKLNKVIENFNSFKNDLLCFLNKKIRR